MGSSGRASRMHVPITLALAFILSVVTAQTLLEDFCPDDWFDGGDLGCYKLLESAVNLTWVEAQEECEQIGGFLAEPKSESHAVLLEELVESKASIFGINHWYIGLTDLGREGEWVWQHSREELTYSNWRRHRPVTTFGNDKDCVAMVYKDNGIVWQDFSCTSPLIKNEPVAAVCEHAITPSPHECPYQWTEFGGHCYRFFKEPDYWQWADYECLEHGAYLVSIHSQEEDDFVLYDLTNDDYDFFLGGYPKTNGGWVWSDGTDFAFVNNGSMAEGGCIYHDAGSIGWSTTYCSSSSYYVCKM